MDEPRTANPITGVVGVFVSLAGVTAALTMLFLGMRKVMEIGGFCAEGGPYVIEDHCPQGAIPLVMIGIWGGIIMAGIYAWQAIRHRVTPSFLGLLWPALFLSLGWNFLEFGLDPPGGSGLAWGWLVPAIAFAAMGGIPLIWALPRILRPSEAGASPLGGVLGSDLIGSIKAAGKVARSPEWRQAASQGLAEVLKNLKESGLSGTVVTGSGGGGVVSALERLDELKRTGAIDDAEYERAKKLVLGEDA